jgi:hypothetical protein
MHSEDLEIIRALNRVVLALKMEALELTGTERLHLEGLAEANEAELRIQVKKRRAAVAA